MESEKMESEEESEEDDITELSDQSGKERHKVYTQFKRPPDSGSTRNRRNSRVTTEPLDQSGKERHQFDSGPNTLRNRRNMCLFCRAWETFNERGSGPRDENNLLSQFLAKPGNIFLVFLFVFVFMFFIFLFVFLCLFVFLFYVK
ncbi:hypothetical protein SO802_022611 [Lithocarpus litseifolius]|uniref:Uncharacterized protein n=1 Tax=Lithocarpus litseifolius TaxID=425828 RepID=A0AAW2C5C9_9ROSI